MVKPIALQFFSLSVFVLGFDFLNNFSVFTFFSSFGFATPELNNASLSHIFTAI